MHRAVTIAIAAVACASPAAAVANPASQAGGRLVGTTQITFGCPGPATEPPCNAWRPFAHARFLIGQRSADGGAKLGTERTVISDARAHFSIHVATGTYVITPLPQNHTHGGSRLLIRVRNGVRTTTLVRFIGFPQMDRP